MKHDFSSLVSAQSSGGKEVIHTIEKGMLKCPTITMDLSVSPFTSVSFTSSILKFLVFLKLGYLWMRVMKESRRKVMQGQSPHPRPAL